MIEGIGKPPTRLEQAAAKDFLDLQQITVKDMQLIVPIYEPGARLREYEGMNVQVGNHIAPPGGPGIMRSLEAILEGASSRLGTPYQVYAEYERIHPFTDGNGRSGRLLWLWMHWQKTGRIPPLGFLHTIYYEMLEHSDAKQPNTEEARRG